MPARPVNAVVAIVLAMLPVPAMTLLDHMNQGCGDGLCGFFPGLLILGSLAVATLVFLVRSARRNETPASLRLVPFVLWPMILAPIVL